MSPTDIHSSIIWATLTGLTFGLSAGIAPGPTLALVITQTLKHSAKEGAVVSVAPVISDLPILALILLISHQITTLYTLIGILSLLGAAYLIYLGIGNILSQKIDYDSSDEEPKSLRKGILVNLLNPNPYIFWFSVALPLITEFLSHGSSLVWAFVGSFYVLFVGTKLILVFVISRYRTKLSNKAYTYAIKALGVIMILFAGIIAYNGIITFPN